MLVNRPRLAMPHLACWPHLATSGTATSTPSAGGRSELAARWSARWVLLPLLRAAPDQVLAGSLHHLVVHCLHAATTCCRGCQHTRADEIGHVHMPA